MKLGTIGSGMIVHEMLSSFTQAEPGCCRAVYSRQEARGRALAEQFGAGKVYTSLEAMLADPELDYIYIASPNSLHYAQARAALEAGKNVLCEKPFTSTAREAEALYRLAEERGLFVYEAVTSWYVPNYRLLREQLPRLGRMRLALLNYSQYSSRYDKLLAGERSNVFDPAFSGGSLMDINYYNIALIVSLFGEPEQVQYMANRSGGVDTSGIALLQYKDFVCQCAGAKDTWGENTVQLEGEGGYLLATGGSNGLETLRLVTRQGEQLLDAQHGRGRWLCEAEALCRLIAQADHADCLRRLQVSVQTVRTVERLRRSAGIVFPADET